MTPDDDKWQTMVIRLMNFIESAPVSSGVCCCGDYMDKHNSSDHSPVDMWDYDVMMMREEFDKMTGA